MQETEYLFVVQTNGAPTNAQARTIINARSARLSHRRRRSRQQQEAHNLVVSDCPKCVSPRSTFKGECPGCQQAVDISTSVTLYHGNSDPFDSLPVPMDAKAIQYFSFARRCIGHTVRGLSPTEVMMWSEQDQLELVVDSSSKDLPSFISRLKTVGSHIEGQYFLVSAVELRSFFTSIYASTTNAPLGRPLFGGQLELYKLESTPLEWATAYANATLAYCAATYWSTTGNQEYHVNALKHTTSCITELRNYLDSADKHPEVKVEEVIFWLLRAEKLMNNLPAARTHLRYIRQLLKRKAEIETLDPESLIFIMHVDDNIAQVIRSRPVLESSWLQKVLAQSWNQADTLFPNNLSYEIDYHAPSIELQELLVATNKFFWQSSILQIRGSLINQTNWHCFASQREWLHNRILHLNIDMVDEDRDNPTKDVMVSSVDTAFKQCLLFGTTLALSYRGKEITIGTTAQMENLSIERRMASTFATLEQITDKDWFRAHIQPIIWILFVTALMEYKIHYLQEQKHPGLYDYAIASKRQDLGAGQSWWQFSPGFHTPSRSCRYPTKVGLTTYLQRYELYCQSRPSDGRCHLD